MSERNVHDPQDPGSELPVEGAVDTVGGTGSTPGSRPTSIHLFPFLASGVELATGFFNRLETQFSGIKDGKRVGRLVVAAGSSVTNLLTSIATGAEDIEDMLQALLSRLDAVKVPVDRMSILSLAYNYAAQAVQFIQVVAAPKAVNGPATLLSNAALADAGGAGADFDMPLPFSNYDTLTVSGYWACGGADTYQLDILARIDDLAAPGDLVNVNALFTPAAALGAPSIGPTTILVHTIQRFQWREVVARRRKVGNLAASVRFGYMMGR
jgi:hypothetical protein